MATLSSEKFPEPQLLMAAKREGGLLKVKANEKREEKRLVPYHFS
jgi:hypothetical protein